MEMYNSSDSPLVSILVPIFNVESYIERCVRSIFEQTYPNLEYVFIDDGSSDSSISVLERVMDDYPSLKGRIHIIHHPQNLGLAAARNTAVESCNGKFVVHVDSDDWIERDSVEKLVHKQKEFNADIVYTSGYFRHRTEAAREVCYGWTTNKDDLLKLFLQDKAFICIWSKLIKRSLYIDNHIRCNEGGSYYEDFQVLSQLLYYSQTLSCLDDAIYHYDRSNPSSIVLNIPNNVEIQMQGLRSIKTVYSFYEDKNPQYFESVKWFYWHYLHRMIDTNSRYRNKEGYEVFANLLKEEELNSLILNQVSCRIEKPSFAELLGYMRIQNDEASLGLKGEEVLLAFTKDLYDHSLFCLCRDNGYLVGMIAYEVNSEGGAECVFIKQEYVSPSYRRKGFYTQMLALSTKDAQAKGFHEMRLEVDKDNLIAQACHSRNGFKKMTIKSSRPNAFIMNKLI